MPSPNTTEPVLASHSFFERNHARSLTLFAVFIRLAIFFVILIRFGDAGFILPPFSDGHGYVTIAQNMLNGHGFSRSEIEPFIPDTKRVPLYPTFLTGTFLLSGGSLWLAALLQTLMSAAITYIVYKFTASFADRRAAYFAALCSAIFPFGAFLSSQILAETMFTLLLFAACVYVFRSMTHPSYRTVIYAGVLIGLSALVKPASQYIPFLLLPFVALTQSGIRKLVYPLIFILCFIVVISPWVIRNKYESGVATLSYEANILFDLHLAGYRSFKETGTASRFPEFRLAGTEEELLAIPRGEFVRLLTRAIVHDPIGFSKYLAVTTVPFVFGDGFVTMVVALSPDPTLPAWDFSTSPSALGRTIGFGVLPPWLVGLSLASKALWAGILVSSIIGFIVLVANGRERRAIALSIAIVVLYFMCAAGPVQSARYRTPVEPLIFILAGVGIAEALQRYDRRASRLHA